MAICGCFASGDPLNNSPLEALDTLNPKALRLEVDQRLANQVIAFSPNRDPVEGLLENSNQSQWTGDVLHQDEPPPRAEDALDFAHSLPIVGDRAQRERANDGIEAAVGKRQRLRVSDAHLG